MRNAFEQVSVQEVLVRFAGAQPEPREIRELLDRDLVRHLEREEEILRHLRDQAVEIAMIGKLVVSGINADGFEDFRIFAQAVPLEARLGKLAPTLVVCWRIELPEPAFVFPTRRADEHATGGKFRRLFFDLVTVKGHAKGCRWQGMKSTGCKSLPKRTSPLCPFAKNFRADESIV